jgi:putative inorganic carbon (HCO3(-)) transporter
VQPLLYPFFLISGETHHAHNLFLQVAVDLGLPGLIAYLALLLGALYATWRVWQRSSGSCSPVPAANPRQAAMSDPSGRDGLLPAPCCLLPASCYTLGLLGGQTALLVHGLLDATAWANKLAVIPWFMLGLAMAAARLTVNGRQTTLDSQSLSL